MKMFFVIDSNIRGAASEWTTMLDTQDICKAVERALDDWDRLTTSEQKSRDAFYLVRAEEDPELPECPDERQELIWDSLKGLSDTLDYAELVQLADYSGNYYLSKLGLTALWNWFQRHDPDSWNGEYFDASLPGEPSGSRKLYPVYEWDEETDQGEIVGCELR